MNRIIIAAGVAILTITLTFAQERHSDGDKALVRRVFIDILSQGKFETASEIFAKDFVKDWQREDLQEKYRGMFSWYLQQKIEVIQAGKVREV
jgi:hypothetical protein